MIAAFTHTDDTFSPHPNEHPEWTGREDINDRGYAEGDAA